MDKPINLMSDTQTRPTAAMRKAISEAEVGDEQMGSDPTVERLCRRVADLLGYEDALFAPSGTMCNQIALLVHCAAGDEIICDASSHIVNTEGAGAAALAGVQIRPVVTATGMFAAGAVTAAVRPATRTGPRSRVVSVEQTTNFLGGRIWPLSLLREVTGAAAGHGLATHLDGARLFNATVATGTEPVEHCADAGFDTAWIDLSKGLGCPLGAVLCGSRDVIEAAWRWKYRLGGAMRQAGILAAAGLYALDHHVARLADDHARAARLAELLVGAAPHLVDRSQIETNIVLLQTEWLGVDAAAFASACRAEGVLLSVIGRRQLRAVTHLDVDDRAVATAANVIARVASRIAAAHPTTIEPSTPVYG
jgi:threonine aldolase